MSTFTAKQKLEIEINEHIVGLQKQIAFYRHQWNSLQPIGKLPHETLSCIFIFTCNLVLGPDPFGVARTSLISLWKMLTHSCTHWRVVALNCPLVWSTIRFEQGRNLWASTALTRALRAPSLYIATRGNYSEHVDQLFSRIKHLRELSLDAKGLHAVYGKERQRFKTVLDSTPAPRLESLEIVGSRETMDNSCLCGMFAKQTPALRTLHVNDHMLDSKSWAAPILRCKTITSLELSFSERNPSRPSADQLVGILSSLQSLEHLKLVFASPTTRPRNQTANLAHLRALYIHDKALHATNTLSCINNVDWSLDSPPFIHLRGEFWKVKVDLPLFHRAIMALQKLSSSHRYYIDKVDIFDVGDHSSVDKPGYWGIRCWSRIPREDNLETPFFTAPWLEFHVVYHGAYRGTALVSFLEKAQFLSRTAALSIRDGVLPYDERESLQRMNLEAWEWSKVFQTFSEAKQVQLYDFSCSRPDFIAALTAPNIHQKDVEKHKMMWKNNKQVPCLQKMKELEILQSSIQNGKEFVEWVKRRAKDGTRLRKLWLTNINWSMAGKEGKALKTLREHVDDFKWEKCRLDY